MALPQLDVAFDRALIADFPRVERILVHESDGWHVYSEDGKKHLGGPYKTKAEALDRLKQVEHFKQVKRDQPHCPAGASTGGQFTGDKADNCGDASAGGTAPDKVAATPEHGELNYAKGLADEMRRAGYDLEAFAKLVPADATAEVTGDAQVPEIEMTAEGWHAYRTFDKAESKIGNETLYVDPERQGQGIGTELLRREIAFAEKAGFDSIELYAAGSPGGDEHSDTGYYVWPSLGFDSALHYFTRERDLRAAIDDELPAARGAESVLDVLGVPGGRKFWKDYGLAGNLTFDTRRGSRSRKAFDAYLAGKKAHGVARALLRDQEHCPSGSSAGGQFTGPNASNCGDAGTASSDPHGFKAGATPAEFLKARSSTTRPGFLSPLTAEDLGDKTLVLSRDGKTGYALTLDGDAENLFNNGGPKGAGKAAIVDAIKRGAKTCDCFDGFLPDLYHDYGFVETGRLKFNDDYAPPGWDFEKYGRPDVVFMAYRGGDRATIDKRVGTFGQARRAGYEPDYDTGKERSREVSRSADGAQRGRVGQGAPGAPRRADGLHRQPVARDTDHCPAGTSSGGQFTGPNADNCGGGGATSAGPSDSLHAAAREGRGTLALGEARPGEGPVQAKARKDEAEAMLKRLGLTESDLLDLFGGDGATVRADAGWNMMRIAIEHGDYHALRSIKKDLAEETLAINNAALIVDDKAQGKGIGTAVLAREVDAAAKLGVTSIWLRAARDPENGYIGYKVWPRMGFDGPIPASYFSTNRKDHLGDKWRGKSMLDLMADPDGRAFWDAHGATIDLAFNPKAGSRSRRALDAYLRDRKKHRDFHLVLFRDTDHCPAGTPAGGQFTGPNADNCGAAPVAPVESHPATFGSDTKLLKDVANKGKGKVWTKNNQAYAVLDRLGWSEKDIEKLFGFEGAEITVGTIDKNKNLAVKIVGPGFEAYRVVDAAARTIENASLDVLNKGRGIGTKLLAREVAEAEALGITKIETAAARSSNMNGYYTWPRLGFDVPISALAGHLVHYELTEKFPHAKTLSDVLMTPEGRAFWKKKGESVAVEFDVRPGSRSRQILEDYVRHRFGHAGTKRAFEALFDLVLLRDEQPRCPSGAPGGGRFSNDAGDGCGEKSDEEKKAEAEAAAKKMREDWGDLLDEPEPPPKPLKAPIQLPDGTIEDISSYADWFAGGQEAYRQMVEKRRAEVEAEGGTVTPEMVKAFQEYLDTSKVAIQIDGGLLDEVARDGFLNQFESKTSNGTLSQTVRALAEADYFGVPVPATGEDRPVYGFMYHESPESDRANTFPVSQYGNVTAILNDDMRPLATVTDGDSLNMHGRLFASSLDDVKEENMMLRPASRAKVYDPADAYRFDQYVEAQLHPHKGGRVSWDDIAELRMTSPSMVPIDTWLALRTHDPNLVVKDHNGRPIDWQKYMDNYIARHKSGDDFDALATPAPGSFR